MALVGSVANGHEALQVFDDLSANIGVLDDDVVEVYGLTVDELINVLGDELLYPVGPAVGFARIVGGTCFRSSAAPT